MKQVLGVDELSIGLKYQASDRIGNVKLLLGQAIGLSLNTKPSKVQKEVELYEEISVKQLESTQLESTVRNLY